MLAHQGVLYVITPIHTIIYSLAYLLIVLSRRHSTNLIDVVIEVLLSLLSSDGVVRRLLHMKLVLGI